MTRAITVRLDEADHAALEKQADHVGVRPGTLARILLHAGLSGDAPVRDSVGARAALERLVRRSEKGAPGDAMALVAKRALPSNPIGERRGRRQPGRRHGGD